MRNYSDVWRELEPYIGEDAQILDDSDTENLFEGILPRMLDLIATLEKEILKLKWSLSDTEIPDVPEGFILVPCAHFIGPHDGWSTAWGIKKEVNGVVEDLHDYLYVKGELNGRGEDEFLISEWPFSDNWASEHDWRRIGWEIMG